MKDHVCALCGDPTDTHKGLMGAVTVSLGVSYRNLQAYIVDISIFFFARYARKYRKVYRDKFGRAKYWGSPTAGLVLLLGKVG